MSVLLKPFYNWRATPIMIGESISYCGVLPDNKPDDDKISGLALLPWAASFFELMYEVPYKVATLQLAFPMPGNGRHRAVIELRYKGKTQDLDAFKVSVRQIQGNLLLMRATVTIKI